MELPRGGGVLWKTTHLGTAVLGTQWRAVIIRQCRLHLDTWSTSETPHIVPLSSKAQRFPTQLAIRFLATFPRKIEKNKKMGGNGGKWGKDIGKMGGNGKNCGD